jgi:predicted nucleic acid-binding protein
MSWGLLFDRADEFDVSREAVQTALSAVTEAREQDDSTPSADAEEREQSDGNGADSIQEAKRETVRVVADADVLVDDLLVGGSARDALDHVRKHDWVELVASDALLDLARATIADLTNADLAADWREHIEQERVAVDHPPGDHPALASAYRGNARHLLTGNENLTGADANLSLQSHMEISIRPPDAFASLFDPATLYVGLFDEPYPGPDDEPRA